jgi:hypothetical protein
MDKKSAPAEEIEALVLSELRKQPHCEGAVRVIIRPYPEPHPITHAHWAPTNINPGTSGVEVCQRALWDVCERLGEEYELAA